MNIDNNHLINSELYDKLTSEQKKEYTSIPDALFLEARLELLGKMETVVGKESTGSINEWAEEKRVAKQMTKRQKSKFSLP